MDRKCKSREDGTDVANVGKITVNGKIVVMGPPSIWTKENYKDFKF